MCAVMFSTLSHADKFTVKYLSCYDGDTCRIDFIKNITEGYSVPAFFGSNARIRLISIDTPELKGSKCKKEKRLAIKARDYLNYTLKQANSIIIDTQERDVFGRYLAVLHADNVNINNLMLHKKYAVKETKGYYNWCK